MARRIWIIAKTDKLDDQDYKDAEAQNCPEIVNGIPPALKDLLAGQKLPIVYEEPEQLPVPEPRNLLKELDELKTKVAKLETKAIVS